MIEYVHYENWLGVILKAIVLKEHDYVPSTGASGMLVECVGVAPFDEQPYYNVKDNAEYIYNIHTKSYEDLGDYRLGIIDPDNVIKRYTE